MTIARDGAIRHKGTGTLVAFDDFERLVTELLVFFSAEVVESSTKGPNDKAATVLAIEP